jgi:hypothetical protein
VSQGIAACEPSFDAAAPAPAAETRPRTRWNFVFDVLMLQGKLFVAGLHNCVLAPATLAAAFLDLVLRAGPHGSRFYRVLDWGRRSEEALGVYAALHRKYETINAEAERGPPEDTP